MNNSTCYRYGIHSSLLPFETSNSKIERHSFPKKILTLLKINNNELRKSIDGLYKDNEFVKNLRFDDHADLQRFLGTSSNVDTDDISSNENNGDNNNDDLKLKNSGKEQNNSSLDENEKEEDDNSTEVVVNSVEKYEDLEDFSNFVRGEENDDVVDYGEDNEIGLLKKALTISCSGLPDFVIQSNKMIESLLNYIVCEVVGDLVKVNLKANIEGDDAGTNDVDRNDVNGNDVNINVNYKWSFVESEYFIESKVLYVRFSDVLTLFLVRKLLNNFKIDVVSPSDEKDLISVQLSISNSNDIEYSFKKLEDSFEIDLFDDESTKIDELRILITERFQLLYNIFESNKDLFEQDGSKIKLDDIAKMYRDYQVDPKELVDVPSDMVESVKQRIIEFRLHAIKVEGNKKSLQLLNDKKKSKMRLKRLFKDLHGHNNKKTNDHTETDVDSDEEDEEEEEETETVDDEEYEKLKEAQNNEVIEKNAYQRLQQAKQRELERIRKYEMFTSSVEHQAYVKTYIPNTRKKNLENFVHGVSDGNNKIDASFNYYVNHSNWLAHRQKKKLEEEKADELDRIEEANERKAQMEAKAFTESISGVSGSGTGTGTGTKLKISLKRKVERIETSDNEEETGFKRRR